MTRGEFQIVGPGGIQTVTGYTSGCWGIWRQNNYRGDGWRLTHLPTGYAMGCRRWRTLQAAKKYQAAVDGLWDWRRLRSPTQKFPKKVVTAVSRYLDEHEADLLW
jgi:hypothetical protein